MTVTPPIPPSTMSAYVNLPQEIHLRIFSFAETENILNAGQTCQTLVTITKSVNFKVLLYCFLDLAFPHRELWSNRTAFYRLVISHSDVSEKALSAGFHTSIPTRVPASMT